MGKRMAMAAVVMAAVAVSVDVCWCSLDVGATHLDRKSESPSVWLHEKYNEVFKSDPARNLMESAGDAAAKMKDTVNSAYEKATNMKDGVVGPSGSVDSYDLHADWPSDDEGGAHGGRIMGPGTTSDSKLDQYMARMKHTAEFDSDSENEADLTDHVVDGINYGRSRLSNSYDHAKQNVNAGMDKVKEKGKDAKDVVKNAMEHGQEKYTQWKVQAEDKAKDEMRTLDESRQRVGDAYDSAKDRMTKDAKATYETAKEKLSEATGNVGDKITKPKDEEL